MKMWPLFTSQTLFGLYGNKEDNIQIHIGKQDLYDANIACKRTSGGYFCIYEHMSLHLVSLPPNMGQPIKL